MILRFAFSWGNVALVVFGGGIGGIGMGIYNGVLRWDGLDDLMILPPPLFHAVYWEHGNACMLDIVFQGVIR